MKDTIINRLASLGYIYTNDDNFVLELLIDKITNHICNNTNLKYIPLGLFEKAVDMVCGEFLLNKYSLGVLDVNNAVSSIKEGDTQVNFASGLTSEETYINYLKELKNDTIDFARFRVMNWG